MLRVPRRPGTSSQEGSNRQEAEMRPVRMGVTAALAAAAITGAALIALQSASPAAQEPKKLEKAAVDKPVASFKLPDLTHEKKDGEKQGADIIALSDYKDKK